jgi:hypothetical protein
MRRYAFVDMVIICVIFLCLLVMSCGNIIPYKALNKFLKQTKPLTSSLILLERLPYEP